MEASASRFSLYHFGVFAGQFPVAVLPGPWRPAPLLDSVDRVEAAARDSPVDMASLGQVVAGASLRDTRLNLDVRKRFPDAPGSGGPAGLLPSIMNDAQVELSALLAWNPGPTSILADEDEDLDPPGGGRSDGGLPGLLPTLLESASLNALAERAKVKPCWAKYRLDQNQRDGPSSFFPPLHVVDFDPSTNVSTSRVAVAVNSAAGEKLWERLDPTSWGEGSKGAFQTYMTKSSPGANGIVPSHTDPKKADPPRVRDQASARKKGPMFEHLCLSVDGVTPWEVKNILDIDYEVSDQEICLKYGLEQSIVTNTAMDTIEGGIDIDRGHCFAYPASRLDDARGSLERLSPGMPRWLASIDWWLEKVAAEAKNAEGRKDEGGARGAWIVHAEKQLRFTDRTPGNIGLEGAFDTGQLINYLTPAILKMFMNEMVVVGVCQRV